MGEAPNVTRSVHQGKLKFIPSTSVFLLSAAIIGLLARWGTRMLTSERAPDRQKKVDHSHFFRECVKGRIVVLMSTSQVIDPTVDAK